MSARKRPCTTCGRTTQAIGRVCRACADDIPLRETDGAWRFDPFRRVQVWVPVEPAKPEPPAIGKLIACPTCRARVDQTCRTASGNPREPHVTRLVGRLCPCGESLEPRKTMCERCRVKARRATFQARERRVPTAARRRREDVAA